MSKLSAVIAEIAEPTAFSERDGFVGSAALTIFVLEALGPLVGYPTTTGGIYWLLGINPDRPVIWQLLPVCLPQIVAAFVAGRVFANSPWGRWISVRLKDHAARIPRPEVQLRATALGVTAGFVAWLLAALQFGVLPESRASLVIAELFVLVVALVVIGIVLSLKPRAQYQITETEDRILWVIPQAPLPTEVMLDATTFLKSIVLSAVPAGYQLQDTKQPLRLDSGETLVLNLGVLEKIVSLPVTVKSANLLQCSARLSVSVGPARPGGLFERHAVQYLLNNFYAKPDLAEFLTSQLSLAMDNYAGEFDAVLKSLTESLSLHTLKSDTALAGSRLKGTALSSPFSGPDPTVDELDAAHRRATARVAELERFRGIWVGARRLQETGKRELPPVFDRHLRAHFRDKLLTMKSATWDSAEDLLALAHVSILVSEVELTERATAAERTLSEVVAATAADLRKTEERLSDEHRKRREELRALLDAKMKDIDPRLLLTPRGKRLFEELMALRTLEWDAVITEAVPKMKSELEEPIGTRVVSPTLRLGRGLVKEGVPKPESDSRETGKGSGAVKFGRTSRDDSGRARPDEASSKEAPPRPTGADDEPL